MGTQYKGPEEDVQALDAYIKLMRAAESVSARVQARLADFDLTLSQFGVLDALYHLGPLTQGELARKILKSSGNITMVVDNLEKRGLALRERGRKDRRYNTVRLTEEGRALFRKILPGHVQAIREEIGVLNSEEQAMLGTLCKKVGLRTK